MLQSDHCRLGHLQSSRRWPYLKTFTCQNTKVNMPMSKKKDWPMYIYTVLIKITLPLKRALHAVGPRTSVSTRASTWNQSLNYCILLRTCEICVNSSVYICKMARSNKIAVEWLESKDKAKINRVNVKHVLGTSAMPRKAQKSSWSSVSVTTGQQSSTFWSGNPERGAVRARTPARANSPPWSSAKENEASKSSTVKKTTVSKRRAKAIT